MANHKIDFSILLMTDFNDTAHAFQTKAEQLLSKENRTADDDEQLNNAVANFTNAIRLKDSQQDAIFNLFHAADTGDIATLQQAFDQGVSVNYLNKGGASLLSFAVASGQTKTVDYLLAQKANPDLKDANMLHSLSALEQATIRDNAKLFNKLVRAGATVDKSAITQLASRNDAESILHIVQKMH